MCRFSISISNLFLREITKKKKAYEAEQDSQSQEMSLNLSEAQISEYIKLKGEASKQSGKVDMKLNSLKQEQETNKRFAIGIRLIFFI